MKTQMTATVDRPGAGWGRHPCEGNSERGHGYTCNKSQGSLVLTGAWSTVALELRGGGSLPPMDRLRNVNWPPLLRTRSTGSLLLHKHTHIHRGVYPYTLVAQMRHIRNWGKGFLGRTKNIDVLMIVMLKLANKQFF